MIHSLAGGKIQKLTTADYAKVQIISPPFSGDIYWYVCSGIESVGDTVVVPIGKNNLQVQAKVLRIDKNISNQVAPVPSNLAKKVIRVLKNSK